MCKYSIFILIISSRNKIPKNDINVDIHSIYKADMKTSPIPSLLTRLKKFLFIFHSRDVRKCLSTCVTGVEKESRACLQLPPSRVKRSVRDEAISARICRS